MITVRIALFAFSLATFAAACGGPPTPPDVPQPEGPGVEGVGPAPTDPAPAGTGSDTPAPGSTGAGPTEPAPKAGGHNVPVSDSKMLDKVKAIGIDLTKAQPLSKYKLSQKKKLMPLFQESLGFKDCQGCHVEGNFKQETKNIKMARAMWNHYVKDLRDAKGGALFCDSCHNGKEHLLPRGNADAIQKFMTEQYEAKLTRADGEEHSCSTCHDSYMETKIFEKLWKIQ